MLRRHVGRGDPVAEAVLLPPVTLDHMRRRHDGADLQARDHERPVARVQRGQSRPVEMIVVAVAEQHEIDRRQVGEIDRRRPHAARTEPGHRTGARGPDRIGQNIQSRDLQQHGGVTDQRGADAVGDALDRRRSDDGRRLFRPARRLPRHEPAQRGERTMRLVMHQIAKAPLRARRRRKDVFDDVVRHAAHPTNAA